VNIIIIIEIRRGVLSGRTYGEGGRCINGMIHERIINHDPGQYLTGIMNFPILLWLNPGISGPGKRP